MYTGKFSTVFMRWFFIGLIIVGIIIGCIAHVAITSAAYDPAEPLETERYRKVDILTETLSAETLPAAESEPAREPLPTIYAEPKYTAAVEFTHDEELSFSPQAHLNGRTGEIDEYSIPVEEYTFNQDNGSVINEGGVLITPEGDELSYTQVLSCQATAYTAERQSYKYTFSGTLARVGAIAVDPSFIPLGSELYITYPNGEVAYGYAVAEDTGGLIKGNIIDLYYDTHDECIQWGRRNVTVYVLG